VWVVCEDDDAVGVIDATHDRMVSTTDVGISPRFVLAAYGSIWVSNYVGSTISRIDPRAGKVVATIDSASGPQLMLAMENGLWLSATGEPAAQEIDPATDRVTTTIDDVGITPDGLCELDGGIWVASESGPELHRIDPSTGGVEGPWVVADQGSISANQLVIAVDGNLWLPLFDGGEVIQAAVPAATVGGPSG
jgi:streptogramin lyase